MLYIYSRVGTVLYVGKVRTTVCPRIFEQKAQAECDDHDFHVRPTNKYIKYKKSKLEPTKQLQAAVASPNDGKFGRFWRRSVMKTIWKSQHENDGLSKCGGRDTVGYGEKTPKPRWPNGAKVAINFVINYEEGGERCLLHGDNESEQLLSEIAGAEAYGKF